MQEFESFLVLLTMLASDFRSMMLVVLLIVAAVIDYRTYRIPNWLTFSGALVGLTYNAFNPGSTGEGLLWSLAGLSGGLAVMLPLYALRVMGAGDVKLMAMTGAFLGLDAIFHATMCTFLVGGLAAFGFATARRVLGRMLSNVRDIARMAMMSWVGGLPPSLQLNSTQSIGKLPYGVSIAVGTTSYLLARQLGYFD